MEKEFYKWKTRYSLNWFIDFNDMLTRLGIFYS